MQHLYDSALSVLPLGQGTSSLCPRTPPWTRLLSSLFLHFLSLSLLPHVLSPFFLPILFLYLLLDFNILGFPLVCFSFCNVPSASLIGVSGYPSGSSSDRRLSSGSCHDFDDTLVRSHIQSARFLNDTQAHSIAPSLIEFALSGRSWLEIPDPGRRVS